MKNFAGVVLILLILAIITRSNVPHHCSYEHCPYKGQTEFKSEAGGCVSGSDCWILDSIHYEHPKWDYDKCEEYLFKR